MAAVVAVTGDAIADRVATDEEPHSIDKNRPKGRFFCPIPVPLPLPIPMSAFHEPDPTH